jgi:hypothetical protein
MNADPQPFWAVLITDQMIRLSSCLSATCRRSCCRFGSPSAGSCPGSAQSWWCSESEPVGSRQPPPPLSVAAAKSGKVWTQNPDLCSLLLNSSWPGYRIRISLFRLFSPRFSATSRQSILSTMNSRILCWSSVFGFSRLLTYSFKIASQQPIAVHI